MDINKVRLQKLNNLFLLTYYNHPIKKNNLCISKQNPTLNAYDDDYIETKEIDIYIDIPTIDYYNDEITHNKIMKFNKKFKVHTLKDLIFNKFEIGDQEANSDNSSIAKIYKLSIRSSGSLRYVGTIKYIVEECYNRLLQKIKTKNDLKQKIELHVSIQVTPTSLRWFSTFLKAELLHGSKTNDKNQYLNCFIDFPLVENSIMMDKVAKPTPFKDYYLKLSSLFQHHEHDSNMDMSLISKRWDICVIVITNSAGIKALLTMLSDGPLDSFLTEDSLVNITGNKNNQSTKDNCSRYHQKTRGRLINERKREMDSVSPLGRRGSSEQEENKDEYYEPEEEKEQEQNTTGSQSRVVRQDKEGREQNTLFSEDIPKLRRDSSSLLSFQDISSNKDKSIRVIPSNTSIKSLNYASIQDGIRRRGYEGGSVGSVTNNLNKEEPSDAVNSLSDQDTYEDDYEEEEDNEDEDNDLGIILHIPTYSQRVQNRELPTGVADKLQKYSFSNKPEIKVEDKIKSDIPAPEQKQSANNDDKYYSEENMEDAMCSTKENSHQITGSYYSNIYRHDGEFDRYNRNNNNNNYYYHRNNSSNGSNNSMNSLLLSTAIRKINARSRRNTLLKKSDNIVATPVPLNGNPNNNNAEPGIIANSMVNSPKFNYSNNSGGTNRNSALNNIHNNSTMIDDSLIPPEFYSRISSPASSRDNSDISLASALFNNNNNNTNGNTVNNGNNNNNNNNNNNMRFDSFSELVGGLGTNNTNTISNYVPPEIFTKYLTTGDPQHILSSTASNTNKNINNNTTVFNAKLINKSFAEFNKDSKNVSTSLNLDNGIEESQFFRLGFKKRNELDDTTASTSTIADDKEDLKSDYTTSSTTSTLHKPNLTGLDIYGGSDNNDNSTSNASANVTTWDYAGNEYSEDEDHIKNGNGLDYSHNDMNYSDSTIYNNKSLSGEDIKDQAQDKDNIGAYKKPAFTLDLYGDDDKDNADVWFLGGNKK
ncbi:Snd1p SCDLUD_001861 [Saccharomycodes ludwigii]|uniref:Snd1p n=1 Tax=Saccharomycodes ludwigii TaxID=36035 RepID=UPI001E8222E5|nr:hypothetical protein SCDLUD_001861 [Saccharomycodes ludwigii]KAH3902050.1 hypothetical protein SCDLUD_001861 [Saccharomycodes ludwigii]